VVVCKRKIIVEVESGPAQQPQPLKQLCVNAPSGL
jgi:hypothetical protein